MPSMYMGKAYGMVECDEIFETDHGKDGITRVGITRPKVRDEEAAKRNRAAHSYSSKSADGLFFCCFLSSSNPRRISSAVASERV
ncbi:MAG: hypothetical protein RR115_08615 [Hydrogenoanaerobacterium sp.]